MTTEYMRRTDIADSLGLGQEYVTDKLTKRPDFPPPAIRLSRKTVLWERDKIEAWVKLHKQKNSR